MAYICARSRRIGCEARKRTLKVVCQVEVGSVSRIVQISETWGIDQKPPLHQRWSEVSIVGPGTYNSEYKEHMVRILIQQ